jgi:hypothetical protein
MAHGFGAGDQARFSNEFQLFGCNCADSGFLIERIQQKAQSKKCGNPLDDLPEPPALVIDERLGAAPPSRIAATFSRRSGRAPASRGFMNSLPAACERDKTANASGWE